jgi:hypothetical protein
VPERLFDYDSPPPGLAVVSHPCLPQVGDDVGVKLRRGGQIIQPVVGAVGLLGLLCQELVKPLVFFRLCKMAADVVQVVRKTLPVRIVFHRDSAELPDAFQHLLAEVIMAPRAAGKTNNVKVGGQLAFLSETEQGGHQLPMGQVAGRAEDDDGDRVDTLPHPRASP